MRKIEQQMLAAIRARKAWRSGATAVTLSTRQDGKPLAEVFLHGNHIATVGYVELMGAAAGPAYHVQNISVTLAGWNTVTTRSRLSAIIRAFAAVGPHGLGVSTRSGQPYLHDAAGKHEITETLWETVALQESAAHMVGRLGAGGVS